MLKCKKGSLEISKQPAVGQRTDKNRHTECSKISTPGNSFERQQVWPALAMNIALHKPNAMSSHHALVWARRSSWTDEEFTHFKYAYAHSIALCEVSSFGGPTPDSNHQLIIKPDHDLLIWIRCVAAEKLLQQAGCPQDQDHEKLDLRHLIFTVPLFKF